MRDTLPIFKDLSDIDWEELPIEYLIIVIRTLLSICKQDGESQIAGEQVVKRLELAISIVASTYEFLAAMQKTINDLRKNMENLNKENRRRQIADEEEIETLRKAKDAQADEITQLKVDKYKMGDSAKVEMKKVQEEKKTLEKNLSRMKTESSSWRTDAKEKSGEVERQKKRISSLEK